MIWYSGNQYHVIYNYPDDRVAYHLTSTDGIHNWTDRGVAYDPRQAQKLFGYAGNTTVNKWYKIERPSVFMDNGHITHFTFAVADVDKNNQIPANSNHGSKVVVVPFDGAALDAETGIGGNGGTGAGGSSSTGGTSANGGTRATGGSLSAGGSKTTGGNTATGGSVTATGGASVSGGSPAAGGSTSTASNTGGTSLVVSASSTLASSAPTNASGTTEPSGCSCSAAGSPLRTTPPGFWGILVLTLLGTMRQRLRSVRP